MAGNVASGRPLAQHVIRGFDPQHCQNRSLESKFLDVTESQIHPALPKQISQPSQAPLLFFLFVLYQYIFCTIDTTSQLWKSDSALLHGWNISKRPHTEMPTQARRGKKNNFEGREERALGSRPQGHSKNHMATASWSRTRTLCCRVSPVNQPVTGKHQIS